MNRPFLNDTAVTVTRFVCKMCDRILGVAFAVNSAKEVIDYFITKTILILFLCSQLAQLDMVEIHRLICGENRCVGVLSCVELQRLSLLPVNRDFVLRTLLCWLTVMVSTPAWLTAHLDSCLSPPNVLEVAH